MLDAAVAKAKATVVRLELNVITNRDYSDVEVTCENCVSNDDCEYAWDHYNTNGDCLAIK